MHGGLNLAKAKRKAPKKKLIALVGPAAFYIGLLIALIAAFIIEAPPSSWLYVVLGVLGVIIGLLNITARETGPFLLATIAFIVAALGMQLLITQVAGPTVPYKGWTEVTQLAANLTVLVGAAAMVIALRAIYEAAKGR